MKTSLSIFLILAAAAALFVGCETPGAKPPIDTTKQDLENQSNVVLLDPGVQKSVTYSGVQANRRPDDSLKEVAVNVRNQENRRLQVQINCEFKDAQGFVVESTPFENRFLDENAQETVRFTTMNNQASRYTIRIRQAR